MGLYIYIYIYIHTHTHTHKLVNTGKRGPPIVPLLFIHFRNTSHMFCTRLANGGLFPTGDPIVPFVISPRFECLNKRTHTHTHSFGYFSVLSSAQFHLISVEHITCISFSHTGNVSCNLWHLDTQMVLWNCTCNMKVEFMFPEDNN